MNTNDNSDNSSGRCNVTNTSQYFTFVIKFSLSVGVISTTFQMRRLMLMEGKSLGHIHRVSEKQAGVHA